MNSQEQGMLKMLHKRASDFVKAKNMNDAVATLKEIISIDPRDFSAFFKLAQICFATKQYKMAEEYSAQAAICAPDDVRPWIILANIYTATGDFIKLANQIPFALTLDPENFQLNYLVGYSMAKKGDFLKAQSYLDKALKIQPNNKQAMQASLVVKQILAKKR